MSHGLKVYNDANELTIDQDYANYALWTTGTISKAVNTLATPWAFPSVVSEPPLLFVYTPSVFMGSLGYDLSGGNFNGIYLCWQDGGNSGATSLSVQYKLFVPTGRLGPSADAYGMRVFRADGSVAFDSGRDYMKIADLAQVTRQAFHSQADYTHGLSGAVYTCINPFCGIGPLMVSPPITYDKLNYGIKHGTGKITHGWYPLADWGPGMSAPYSGPDASLISVQ